MTGSGSPCGACKFLRRRCVKGCVFAPYFCHEQGASHFAAIHQVFGASNASKLLSHLPMEDRREAATTIYYEAQARRQDPIYGCVSHIFSLQQQVVNLQTQLEILKQQATQRMMATDSPSIENPNYYQDTKPQYLQESHDLHHQHHQTTSNYQTEQHSDLKNIITSCYHQNETGMKSFIGAGGDTTAASYYYNSSSGCSEELKSVSTIGEFSKYSELDQQHLNTFNQYHDGCNDLLSESLGYITYS
ncbi:Lateral organ boundaries LOB [Arabidopsis thaliana x Arabidopsis arenosa]|uniref:Lateral organ boundaries LOB n=1 Tax=Arabidopsis thaliana x Arabidopsis arenosa TaxID=1240361 RepID=A0A8T2A9J4_9BRAS|nr:Lateral organ boundaries LOB [Arabidopsis thaliana x Arabidopsis arenosa]